MLVVQIKFVEVRMYRTALELIMKDALLLTRLERSFGGKVFY